MFPDHKLIITIDHTLLMEYLDEVSEVDLINRVSRLGLTLKKEYGAMVILLGQLNDKLEQPDRIKIPQLQYPKKMDIHGGKSIYMIADTVIIIHRPESLNITKYGPHFYDTKDLVCWHFLKSRLNGTEGIVRMKQNFAEGTLIPWYDVNPEEEGQLSIKKP